MKQTELEERFEQWIKGQDKTTTDKLVEIYNRTFNSTVERQIDVSSFDYFPNAAHTKNGDAAARYRPEAVHRRTTLDIQPIRLRNKIPLSGRPCPRSVRKRPHGIAAAGIIRKDRL